MERRTGAGRLEEHPWRLLNPLMFVLRSGDSMTVVDCPVCGSRVNAEAVHCPECGADPRLAPDLATADLQARGLSLPVPRIRKPWTRRRRLTVIALVAIIVLALLAPWWSGYFGPTTAAYVTTWLPWRSHLAVHYVHITGQWPQRATVEITYQDPWPGQARSSGQEQTDFLTLVRFSPWLPWVVTERGTGP
jgi:hypothetical protein